MSRSGSVGFDQSVVDAVDCLIESRGIEDAYTELVDRRRSRDGEMGRLNEALAYLKRNHEIQEGDL